MRIEDIKRGDIIFVGGKWRVVGSVTLSEYGVTLAVPYYGLVTKERGTHIEVQEAQEE